MTSYLSIIVLLLLTMQCKNYSNGNLKLSSVICIATYDESDKETLREKCPNTEFFLIRIYPHSDWIRRETLRIQSECWKIRTRKAPYLDTFHAVERTVNRKIYLNH